ncbi:PAAR domain-containing protein [Ralstonia sp. 25C]|uniref:PAAR domain-containing protein n=1 Tax=Ralstonia sp. 25C TaxID=3447363 RepID=UPI003F755E99
MMKKIARFGDSTTTGGKIIYTPGTCMDNGRVWAVAGSLATCGECKGSFGISASAHDTTDEGKAAVVDDDLVLCPCGKNRVIAGADAGTSTEVGHASHKTVDGQREAEPHRLSDSAQSFDEQYVLFDSDSGAPLANVHYRICTSSGQVFSGVTDASGLTQRVKTFGAESLRLEIVQ